MGYTTFSMTGLNNTHAMELRALFASLGTPLSLICPACETVLLVIWFMNKWNGTQHALFSIQSVLHEQDRMEAERTY
jgi:hypothetical protein